MYHAPTLHHPTAFASRVAEAAQNEYDQFKHLHDSSPALRHRVRQYWQAIQLAFPGTQVPWGAVFVSYCVQKAGATAEEFRFCAMNAGFTMWAIRAAERNDAPFQGYPVHARPVEVGDILIQRVPGSWADFEEAKTNPHLDSLSAIVVDVQEDDNGRYALTVRGNANGSFACLRVPLEADGHINSHEAEDYICVIKNLM